MSAATSTPTRPVRAVATTSAPSAVDAPLSPVLRRLLVTAAVLVFLAGVQLFVFPLRTDRYFAWTIDSPMTATFLGASYWSAVALELGGARTRTWSGARIAVPAVGLFTAVTLIVTVAHLDLFHLGTDIPLTTRAVAWAWIGVYALVPPLLVAGSLAQRRRPGPGPSTGAVPTDHPPAAAVPVPHHAGPALPSAVRATLVALAALLVGLGVALLVAPTWADGTWPWTLTPLTARAVGAWLLGLGTAAAHARLLDDAAAIRPLATTGVTFGVLQAAALARHGDELSRGTPRTVAYIATIATLTAVSAWVLRRRR